MNTSDEETKFIRQRSLLKMAKESGFQKVVGIEASVYECEMAEKYRDSLGLDYKIVNKYIDKDFDFNSIPAADVVLLSTFHYHLPLGDFIPLLDGLERKTCYCLVVSIDGPQGAKWKAHRRLDEVKRYFSNWEEKGIIPLISREGDPHPRRMYGILYKSKLKRIPIKDVRGRTSERITRYDSFVGDFIGGSLKQKDFDVTKTIYYDVVRRRNKRHHWSTETLFKFMEEKKELIRDIAKNGVKEPIILDSNNVLVDGSHRLTVERIIGHKSIIARDI